MQKKSWTRLEFNKRELGFESFFKTKALGNGGESDFSDIAVGNLDRNNWARKICPLFSPAPAARVQS